MKGIFFMPFFSKIVLQVSGIEGWPFLPILLPGFIEGGLICYLRFHRINRFLEVRSL